MTVDLQEVFKKSNAYNCLECGKCTGICPVARYNNQFSPRSLLTRAIREDFESVIGDYNLWSCLTCRKCDQYCMADIDYIWLIQSLRAFSGNSESRGKCSHSGAIQSMQRMMATPELKQKRMDWITSDLKISDKGDILYYVGCSPYLDTFFSELNLNLTNAMISSVRILNKMGVTPALLEDERCCGHDQYWTGDEETFRKLAELNIEAIKSSGAKTILFSCAECLSTFKNLYPKLGYTVKAELMHTSQFFSKELEKKSASVNKNNGKVTFHDPCRLGRHLGIYDDPRNMLEKYSSYQIAEMKMSGSKSLCCGVSTWMNCDIYSKAIQTERLKQATDTGAKLMAVACPKCKIHFSCALRDKTLEQKYKIEIKDIAEIVAENIEGIF